jgi:type II secretory ATPase GspE/PulE/Tfp pilus assembly ATPase PilB-like protein
VEDPVEQTVAGINQVSINEKIGFDFPTALRALLRQDPDVLMVGEIRDLQTALVAAQAAQTGHLVLSTLHTNTAASAVLRLRHMGVPPDHLAASLRLVCAQRLVRMLCMHCRVPTPSGPWRAAGCDHCQGGYSGRQAVHEVIPMTAELNEGVRSGLDAQALEQAARRQGIPGLGDTVADMVAQGLTSQAEADRVSQSES